ncbi:MAG: hypothetical protein Q8S73_23960 [Deltaproteobacteria bacterium]|nr:hypothetical protein [Myxococcales bacterium]MDP3217188.1 hypothetical protein [Deltaproteobacteria bacterium]
MPGVAALTLLLGVALAQLSGAEAVTRPGTPPTETPLDAVLVSIEPESDPTPRFVLQSDFVLLLRTELATRGAPGALRVGVDATVSLPVLEQLMAETVVVREAQRAGLDAVEPDELAAARAQLIDRMAPAVTIDALLRETGTSAPELDALLRRRVVAERYLLSRRPELLEPSEEEMRAAFEQERFRALAGDGATSSGGRAAVRRELVRRALPRALRQYLRALGSRVRVRRFRDV